MRLVARVVWGLLLGLFLGLYLLQNNSTFQFVVEHRSRDNLANVFATPVSCHVDSINFFVPEIVFRDVYMADVPEGKCPSKWHWRARSMRMGCSWLDWMIWGAGHVKILFDNMYIYSSIDDKGALAIASHLQDMTTSSFQFPIPLTIKEQEVINGQLLVEGNNGTFTSGFHISSSDIAAHIKTVVHMRDGIVSASDRKVLENLNGTLQMDMKDGQLYAIDPDIQIQLCDTRGDLLPLAITGSLGRSQGSCSVESLDGTCRFGPIHLYRSQGQWMMLCQGQADMRWFPLLWRLYSGKQYLLDSRVLGTVEWVCDGPLSGLYRPQNMRFDIKNFAIDDMSCQQIHCDLERAHHAITGQIQLQDDRFDLTGRLFWDEALGSGYVHGYNNSCVGGEGSFWKIAAGKLRLFCSLKGNEVNAVGALRAHNEKTGDEVGGTGTIQINDRSFDLSAEVGSYQFGLQGNVNPFFSIRHAWVSDDQKDKLLNYTEIVDDKIKMRAQISYRAVQLLMAWLGGNLGPGKADISFEGVRAGMSVAGDLKLTDGHIRFPFGQNGVRDLFAHLTYDGSSGRADMYDMCIGLYKGQVRSDHANVLFESFMGRPSFLFLPLFFDHCFLQVGKGIHMFISGHSSLILSNADRMIRNALIIENGVCVMDDIRDGVDSGSASLADVIGAYDWRTDTVVAIKSPFHVQMPFVQTDINGSFTAHGSLAAPEVGGQLELYNGQLILPYKNLYVQRGYLSFVNNQLMDPAIELVAKNRIKRYNVALRLSGSAQQPQIVLESVPHLSQEKLLGLLFSGSEQDSLNESAPALVLNNLASLLFYQTKRASKTSRALQKVLKPLDHVHLVPHFSDQTGRAGFGGSLEIDVNDRLRAIIEKDLSVAGDPKLELEYLLTDEVSVRGIKDEQGDLGGEIEMRWKF